MSQSKGNKSTKKASPKKRQSKSGAAAEQEALEKKRAGKARVFSIVILAVSLLLFFIAVLGGQGAWNVVHNVYVGIFGWFAAIALPILCGVYAFLYNVKKSEKNMTFEITLIFILVILASALIHIIENEPGGGFKDTIVLAFNDAPSVFNGGFIGAVVGWAFLTFGKAPAIAVTLILALTDVILLSKATVNEFFDKTTRPARKAVKKVENHIEEHREQRRMTSRDIDVPLDKDSPELNGEVIDNQKKGKKKKKTEEPVDDYSKLIKDINDSSKKMESKLSGKKDKSNENEKDNIDNIVDKLKKDSGEKSGDKKDAKPDKAKQEKKDETPEFTVSEEDMNKSVKRYVLPPVNLLTPAKHKSEKDISSELKDTAELLIKTLDSFGVSAEITDISRGPTVTRYELKPAAGVRISKIENLSKEIALNLAATNVRIEAPIPGKAAVGIEIPNHVKNMVSMREVVDTPEFHQQKSLLSAGLGKDIGGKIVFCDIAKMPHLLIAGTTGSGKSVCMNSIIVSILYRATPEEVKFLMIDPKKVEFSKYAEIPHLLVPVVTDPKKASGALGWAVSEMLRRYQLFSDTGVRDITGYNKYVEKHKNSPAVQDENGEIKKSDELKPLPKIVICIDELADLMMASPKEVEDSICRLAQMARAAGMHLVIATQRPSVDVITGLIKANISSRIALTVSSAIDSRTILDTGGAEKLLGRGDMLYSPIGSSKPLRVQGCFISDEEVESLCDYIRENAESQYDDDVSKEIEHRAAQDSKDSPFGDEENSENFDPLFEKAVDTVLDNGRASTSFLQRKLGVGYSRGSKIMDQLEEKGIIGPQDGAKPREIRINKQQWIQMKAAGPAPNNKEFTADNTVQMTFDDAKENFENSAAENDGPDTAEDENYSGDESYPDSSYSESDYSQNADTQDDDTPPWDDDEQDDY